MIFTPKLCVTFPIFFHKSIAFGWKLRYNTENGTGDGEYGGLHDAENLSYESPYGYD